MERNTASGRGRAFALVGLAAAATAVGGYSRAGGEGGTDAVTRYGAPITVGQGTARTYITTANGKIDEVGVALAEAALVGLPDEHGAGGVHAHGHTTFEQVLELPAGNPTPFRHVLLNWNPGGHEPPGIYDLPHFDFHFYVIDQAERLAIDPADPDYQRKAERKPASELVPERYIMPEPLPFARMGVHWVDSTASELRGERFTRTFIYGSWDGKVIFVEPMVTKAYLETKPQFSGVLPAPRRGGEAGYYPSEYRVRWDEGTKEYRIALAGVTGRK